MTVSNLKIDINTRELRCKKCYRLHPLEMLSINRSVAIGYRCNSHKNAIKGSYYIALFAMQKCRQMAFFDVTGHIKELSIGWFEVSVSQQKNIMIQQSFNFL